MPRFENLYTFITAGVVSGLAYLVGGADNLISALALFVVMDYITGVTLAAKEKNLNSEKGFWGVGKKVLLFFFVIVANQVDVITGNNQSYLRNAVVMFLIGTEGVSILENLGKLGLPVPSFIINTLAKLRDAAKGE